MPSSFAYQVVCLAPLVKVGGSFNHLQVICWMRARRFSALSPHACGVHYFILTRLLLRFLLHPPPLLKFQFLVRTLSFWKTLCAWIRRGTCPGRRGRQRPVGPGGAGGRGAGPSLVSSAGAYVSSPTRPLLWAAASGWGDLYPRDSSAFYSQARQSHSPLPDGTLVTKGVQQPVSTFLT